MPIKLRRGGFQGGLLAERLKTPLEGEPAVVAGVGNPPAPACPRRGKRAKGAEKFCDANASALSDRQFAFLALT